MNGYLVPVFITVWYRLITFLLFAPAGSLPRPCELVVARLHTGFNRWIEWTSGDSPSTVI